MVEHKVFSTMQTFFYMVGLTDNDLTNLNSNLGNAEKRAPDCRMVGSEILRLKYI